MKIYKKPSIDNRKFIKSSFSQDMPGVKCVDVSIGDDDVLVTNFSIKSSAVVVCSHDEWGAFIKGVKEGEFDLKGTK